MFKEIHFDKLALLPLVDNVLASFERQMKEGTIRLTCLAIQDDPEPTSPRFVRGFLDVDLTFPSGAMFVSLEADKNRERYRKYAVFPATVFSLSGLATMIAGYSYYRECGHLFGSECPPYWGSIFEFYPLQIAGLLLIAHALWLGVIIGFMMADKRAMNVSPVSLPPELESFVETIRPFWKAALELSEPQSFGGRTAQATGTGVAGAFVGFLLPFPLSDKLAEHYSGDALGLTRGDRVAAALNVVRVAAVRLLYDGHRRSTARLPSMLGAADIDAGHALDPEKILVLDPESLQSSILWYRDVSGEVAIPSFPGVSAICDVAAAAGA